MLRAMRATLIALLFFALPAQAADFNGRWEANLHRGTSELQLNFFNERGGMQGFGAPISALTGITAAQIASSTPVHVTFQLPAAAGTFEFRGTFVDSKGSGDYRFVPNARYRDDMRALGYTDLEERTLFLHAMSRLTPEWIRELQAMGYAPAKKELDTIAIFEITPAYVREMNAAGFRDLSIRDLQQLRIGDIDAIRLREYKELGLTNLTAQSVAKLGIHDVTPAFVRELRAAGYADLTPAQLVKLSIGDITADDIRAYRELGYENIPFAELAQLGIHEVTPEYIRALAKLGYTDIPVRTLIKMKIHDLTPEFIESMRKK